MNKQKVYIEFAILNCHKIILTLLHKYNYQIAYTQDGINKMFKMLEYQNLLEKNKNKMIRLISENNDCFTNVENVKNEMKKEYLKIKFEQQKEIIYKYTNKHLTIEELFNHLKR